MTNLPVQDVSKVLDHLLEEKIQDPSNLPKLLKYGADFLADWGTNRVGAAPPEMLLRCAKIMRAARDHLQCEQSSEQPQA